MRLLSDWKFVVTLAAAIAGVIVPVWLWQADLSSKSLAITLSTRVSLQPAEKESLQGMEISFEGKHLDNPHLVILEITNDGSKPILANDFESPLEIRLSSETHFVHSRITDRSPKDIDTDLSIEKNRVSLKPALLNPKDTIRITAITDGIAPTFEAKTRVVGIPSITITDNTVKQNNKAKLILLLIAAVFLAVASQIAYEGTIFSKGVFLRRRAAAFVALISVLPSVAAFITFLEEINITSFWQFMMYYLLMSIPVGFMASALNRKQAIPEKSSSVEKP